MTQQTITHWFQYFPESFMWSQGIMSAIEMIPYGAAAMGEIDQVGQRLKGREGDNEAWCDEWSKMAEKMERRADEAAAANHALTAGTSLPACMDVLMATASAFCISAKRSSMCIGAVCVASRRASGGDIQP